MEAKITFKNTLLHFKKICVHKFWVAHYCFKIGLYWQGIMHDISKFSWTEFWESVKYYQGTSSPINVAKADKGYSLAWQHHKGRNPHHYEYWTDKYDEGTIALKMPYKYVVELICDWLGAGKAYMGDKFTYLGEYEYVTNRLKIAKIHPDTAKFLKIVFYRMVYLDINYVLRKEALKHMYDNLEKYSDIL